MPVRRPSRSLTLRSVVVVLVAVAAVLIAVRGPSHAASQPAVSTQPTSWQLPRLGGGGEVNLAGLHGRPLVVNFFASWCTACEGELPGFQAVSAQLKGRVTFAGVNSQETGDGLAMASRFGIDWWPLAADSGGTSGGSGLHDALGARGMPLTAFYDANGHLLRVVTGAISEDDLKARLRDLYGVSV